MAFKWYNGEKKTRWLRVNQVGFIPFVDKTMPCPSCSETVSKNADNWISKCKTCGVLVSFFKGTPIQEIACSIESPVVFNIGAVGSGKTTNSAYMISNHMRMYPGASVISFALTLEQLKKFAIPELEKFIHSSEIQSKNQTNWLMTNGSQISFMASDNEDKFRSANATAIWLVEGAPNKMFSIFRQGLSRLRNANAIEYETTESGEVIMMRYPNGKVSPKVKSVNTLMLVEANPKKGSWLRAQILKSHTVFYTNSVRGIPVLQQSSSPQRIISEFTGKEMNAEVITVLNATVDNPVLPETFLSGLRASMASQEEYDREVYCDMTSADGLVFKSIIPKLNDIFIPMHATYSPNPNEVWVESMDPGGSNDSNDPTCYILMRFNKVSKTIAIVDGFYLSGQSLSEDAQRIMEIRARHHYNVSRSLLFTGDNVLDKSLKFNKHQSLRTEYEVRLGSHIQVCNNKGIKQGIGIVLDWFDMNAISISDQLNFIRAEIIAYEYITKKEIIKDVVVETQKFSAGFDHAIDVIRYAIVMLEQMGYRQDQHRLDANRSLREQSDNLLRQGGDATQKQYYSDMGKLISDRFLPNFDKPVPQTDYLKKKFKF